jgi:hypothetical protein
MVKKSIKTLAIASVFTVAMASPSFAGLWHEWMKASSGETSVDRYVDLDTVKTEGSLVFAFELWDYERKSPWTTKPVRSEITRVAYNCDEKYSLVLGTTGYSFPMGKGEVLERTDYHILRRVYLNMVDAMGAPMLKLACTYAKMWGK